MSTSRLPDWNEYWRRSQDLNLLNKKSADLDGTFLAIEEEFGCKLLSGDHLQIISALEDRIDELEMAHQTQGAGLQTDLFDA